MKQELKKYIVYIFDKIGYENKEIINRANSYLDMMFDENKTLENNKKTVLGIMYTAGLLEGERRMQREFKENFNITEGRLRKEYTRLIVEHELQQEIIKTKTRDLK